MTDENLEKGNFKYAEAEEAPANSEVEETSPDKEAGSNYDEPGEGKEVSENFEGGVKSVSQGTTNSGSIFSSGQ